MDRAMVLTEHNHGGSAQRHGPLFKRGIHHVGHGGCT